MQTVPLDPQFLVSLKNRQLDAQNKSPIALIAKGGEPLRDTFMCAVAGEEILLASYSPQQQQSPYKEFGPIFVSKACKQSQKFDLSKLLSDHTETAYLGSKFVIKAYNDDEHIVIADIVAKATAKTKITEYLKLNGIAYVQLRFAAFGCYAAKVTRIKNE